MEDACEKKKIDKVPHLLSHVRPRHRVSMCVCVTEAARLASYRGLVGSTLTYRRRAIEQRARVVDHVDVKTLYGALQVGLLY